MLREAEVLADRLRAEGFAASIKHNGTAVYGWNSDEDFACAFYWVQGKGWRFDVAQPRLYTHADIEFAMEELKRAQASAADANKAWDAYKKKQTERSWQNYQGVLAASFFRQIGGAKK